ncbi:hypothetical protein GCM10023258_04750 [Terrabacter aeriphilus]|uniref:Membrane alanyl aminopeptidase n=1 Tax=Terrabacter aeriphilus TaxID=515662 RepID=A0ABP9J366_9MICO
MRPISTFASLTAAAALAVLPLGAATGAPRAASPASSAPTATAATASAATASGVTVVHRHHGFRPGAGSVGDPYVGHLGNGGYDVRHYDLAVSYDPATDRLRGRAGISAVATQDLSRFNLDLVGLTVRSVTVDGRAARWNRAGGELRITPPRGLRTKRAFTTVVVYDGVPATLPDGSGFVHTGDGALVIGEPEVAATWFPVNDHPSDKATYHFDVTVPKGLTAVANGSLTRTRTHHGWTTWTWDARAPMASYLATATIGRFDLRRSTHAGIAIWDAVDPALHDPVARPRTGSSFAISGQADSSYKRLTRTIAVPAGGASVTFWVTRRTEQRWDHFFVEARHPGGDDWTTLPDANGHSSADTGDSCPQWLELHPFLTHYQHDDGDGTCTPSGTTGQWNAAAGKSSGPEQWRIDLTPYAGSTVELSLSYASDQSVQLPGVFIDDIAVSTGEGSTSFEPDGDVMDGWTVPGPPAGSPVNENDWSVGGVADVPPPPGVGADASLARESEVLDFLSATFGRYPFRASGGIVDDDPDLGFALENQTRPIYSQVFFDQPEGDTGVVVHELAHQWFGDSVSVRRWKDIWLNEGFATYAEWLWSEHDGQGSAQENFDFWFGAIASQSPFWQVVIGDPGRDLMFDDAVYLRGGMTLHQLRLTVGDEAFFTILRTWARTHRYGNGTTGQFIALAERVSHRQLDAFFDTWLRTPGKPVLPGAAPSATGRRAAALGLAAAPAGSRSLVIRFKQGLALR